MDIDECKTDRLSACGRSGTCENTPGSYRCICDEIEGKCGKQCDLDDPCQKEKPCEHGSCKSHCTETPDYLCICEEDYVGKNCSDKRVRENVYIQESMRTFINFITKSVHKQWNLNL